MDARTCAEQLSEGLNCLAALGSGAAMDAGATADHLAALREALLAVKTSPSILTSLEVQRSVVASLGTLVARLRGAADIPADVAPVARAILADFGLPVSS